MDNPNITHKKKREPKSWDKRIVLPETVNFLTRVFDGDNEFGYIRTFCDNNKKGIKPTQGHFCSKNMPAYLNSPHTDWLNYKISLATYYNKKVRTEWNIRNVNALCVRLLPYKGGIPYGQLDRAAVSYFLGQREQELEVTYEDYHKIIGSAIVEMMQSANPVLPQYMIAGSDFTLVFLFKNPVFLPKARKAKKNVIDLLHKVNAMLAQRVMATLKELGFEEALTVEPLPLNAYISVPQSREMKFEPRMKLDRNIGKLIVDGYDKIWDRPVRLIPADDEGPLFTLPELVNILLPPVADWRDSWLEKKHAKKPFISISPRRFYIRDMLNARIAFLEKLQKLGYEDGRREDMCFLYANFKRQLGASLEESIEMAKRFNNNFKKPLLNFTIQNIWSEASYDKTYKFTNETEYQRTPAYK